MKLRLVSALVFTLAVPLAAAPALAAAAQCPTHVDVRNLMTVTQYDQAGLNKLDKKQLESLNAWLSHYIERLCSERSTGSTPTQQAPSGAAAATAGSKPPPPSRQPSAQPTQSEPRQAPSTPPANSTQNTNSIGSSTPKSQESGNVESRIVGDFYGWTGKTVFRLENGQVWKQAGPGYFRVHLKNPKVVIKQLLIGYVLLLKGYGREVFVRRIH